MSYFTQGIHIPGGGIAHWNKKRFPGRSPKKPKELPMLTTEEGLKLSSKDRDLYVRAMGWQLEKKRKENPIFQEIINTDNDPLSDPRAFERAKKEMLSSKKLNLNKKDKQKEPEPKEKTSKQKKKNKEDERKVKHSKKNKKAQKEKIVEKITKPVKQIKKHKKAEKEKIVEKITKPDKQIKKHKYRVTPAELRGPSTPKCPYGTFTQTRCYRTVPPQI